ncbi:alpha/beta hydrolase [Methylocella silvestris]|uniref:Palmitoyl-protein thioesterase ABHD10, mitochondrial n=1 Tax=Methylocella silvestris TaxID=199596 RepID=A0A2J7TGX6_METSI|nr:alpha/beta hydrolase [Methylocella silvestris]PNG26006.1 alpha/beta hydrolase [Methylocella silvestris]
MEGQAAGFASTWEPDTEFLTVGAGGNARRIAFLRGAPLQDGGKPGIVWLGGFRSTMRGEKAAYLHQASCASEKAFLRFDYSGHGESEGRFEDGTIGRWLEESLAVLRELTVGPQILVGSSMGGWLALLVARALSGSGESGRLHGMALIAPAVDFTETLIFARMSKAERAELKADGRWLRPSRYGDGPYPISREFLEEGRRHLLFGGSIASHCPAHILQGMQDEDVPWRHALTLVEHMHGDPATLTLIKDGDHRLSRPQDLARIWAAVEGMGG